MKRFFAIMMVLGLCITNAQAQSYFNLRDPLHSFSSILTSVQPSGGKYYCTGITWDSSNYIGNNQAWPVWGVRFAVYDENGNKLRDTIYQRSFVELGLAQGRVIDPWHNTLQRTDDGNFILAAYSYDYDTPVYNIRAALIKLDTMGRCTMFREYEKPFCQDVKGNSSNHIFDLQPDGYGGWLLLTMPLCQSGSPSIRHDYALTKLDSAFNVVWSRQYSNGSFNSFVNKVLVEPDGYLLVGGRNNIYHTNIGYVYQAQFIKTDTAGNELWRWESDPAKKITASDVVRTPDGGYVYCGSVGQERLSANGQAGEVYWKGWVEKLDAARNPQWSKTTGNAYTSGDINSHGVLHLLPGGDMVVAGAVADTVPPPAWGTQEGSLMRLGQDGTLRWHRRYSLAPDTFVYIIYDMKPTADGGFVMVGQARDDFYPYTPPTQRGWIIKVDSNGCMSNNDPQCWPTAVPLTSPKTKEVIVYPNPAGKHLHVRYAATDGQQATVLLYDLMGRTVLSAPLTSGETPLDISALPAGSYLWRIVEGGAEKEKGKFVKD